MTGDTAKQCVKHTANLTLTKPAIGVERRFNLLMMPGFNWFIKL